MKRGIRICVLLAAVALLGCLLAGAAMADGVTLADSLYYEAGWTTITWSGSSGTCRVYQETINNGEVEQDLWNLGTSSNGTIQSKLCVPGKAYRISVCDENDNILAEKDYWLPQAPTFQDGKLKNTSVKITTEMRSYQNANIQNHKKVNRLSARDIIAGEEASTYYYGMKYQMRMPTLAKPRTFFVTLVYEAPNGFVYVDKAQDITFDKVNGGYQTIWWDIAGVNFFDSLYHTTGTVPVGTYQATLYWDGMWVNTLEFQVRE